MGCSTTRSGAGACSAADGDVGFGICADGAGGDGGSGRGDAASVATLSSNTPVLDPRTTSSAAATPSPAIAYARAICLYTMTSVVLEVTLAAEHWRTIRTRLDVGNSHGEASPQASE